MFHQMLVWTKHVKNEMNKTSWFLYVQLNEIHDGSASKIKINTITQKYFKRV